MNPTPRKGTVEEALTGVQRELSQIKGLLIALLVIIAMGTFLPQSILGIISLVVLLLAIAYVVLSPFDRLLKRRMEAYDQEIERKVLESVGGNSVRNESQPPGRTP